MIGSSLISWELYWSEDFSINNVVLKCKFKILIIHSSMNNLFQHKSFLIESELNTKFPHILLKQPHKKPSHTGGWSWYLVWSSYSCLEKKTKKKWICFTFRNSVKHLFSSPHFIFDLYAGAASYKMRFIAWIPVSVILFSIFKHQQTLLYIGFYYLTSCCCTNQISILWK